MDQNQYRSSLLVQIVRCLQLAETAKAELAEVLHLMASAYRAELDRCTGCEGAGSAAVGL
jgi:hypothetical protein